ncbi:MAG: dephospho-CoA kinase [Fulvimarina manganoxydans]|uniref:dephospho-CoA kinase n=1 Tax=Fulvimarina manganoxydans TaxID=937218 RepID=UPI002355C520|nr:dephospho-CoA kinase [Fulvimarina manganoxydans]MCK5934462.1 dephospho-CoA kinase [Fulvimarina manganoxydans]
MIRLGLTGSIGMGKSTTAEMFVAEGIPIHSADAAVHRLYAGRAAPLIEDAFPGVVENGVVDRARLSERVLGDKTALKRLEAIIHPLVREEEERFVAEAEAGGSWLVVLDIPLLYETGAEARCDKVLVVTAAPDIQQARVLARPGMTAQKFEAILRSQVPDAEKRRRADFLVETGSGIEPARMRVRQIIAELQDGSSVLSV